MATVSARAQPDTASPRRQVAAPSWKRVSRAVAVGSWLVVVALSAAEFLMIAATLDRPSDQWGIRGYEAVMALSFGSVGAIVATRRPGNLVGWLALLSGLGIAFQGIVVQYPVFADATVPPLAGAELARWLGAWVWVVNVGMFLTMFPLFFPDGRLPSGRWRPAVLLGLAAIGVQIGLTILVSRPLGPVEPTNNPAPYFESGGPWVPVGYLLLWLAGGVSTISLIQRYRRSAGDERAQIKWVAYAIAVVILGAAIGMTPFVLGQMIFLATALFAAAAIAIAILRYRLYEIDVIINRTLVYGALSAVLAGVYTASITLSQRLFMAFTGERSDAAIVLTTLIVAATFTPLKARLQAVVDRRITAATPASAHANGTQSSLETLEALAALIRLNASGGLTREEFRSTKAELLRRV